MSRGLGRRQRLVLRSLLACERRWEAAGRPRDAGSRVTGALPVWQVMSEAWRLAIQAEREDERAERKAAEEARLDVLREAAAAGSNSAAHELAELAGFRQWLGVGAVLGAMWRAKHPGYPRRPAQMRDRENLSRAITGLVTRGLVWRYHSFDGLMGPEDDRAPTGPGAMLGLTEEGRRIAVALGPEPDLTGKVPNETPTPNASPGSDSGAAAADRAATAPGPDTGAAVADADVTQCPP